MPVVWSSPRVPPEQVAEVPGSFTGQYLKPLLKRTRHCGRQHNNKKSAGA